MDLDELNRELQKIQDEHNQRPVDEFEGRTPAEMFFLINKPFDQNSPLQFRDDPDRSLIGDIPFVKLADYYLRNVEQNQPVKLTKTGNLPVKMVKDLYDQRIMTDEHIERGITKLYKETDSYSIHTVRIICDIAGLTKKRHNKMTLTKSGTNLIHSEDIYDLFKTLFITYTTRFNWAYHDGYGDHPVGQTGFAFVMEQVSKHGHMEKPASFYGENYLRAFPFILDYLQGGFRTPEEDFHHCFSYRTIEGFLSLFGLIELRKEGKDWINKQIFIRKSPVLDEVFRLK